jgi:hypothetical protein
LELYSRLKRYLYEEQEFLEFGWYRGLYSSQLEDFFNGGIMKDKLRNIVNEFVEAIREAKKEADVFNVKAKYLGKKSDLFSLIADLKNMSNEERKNSVVF